MEIFANFWTLKRATIPPSTVVDLCLKYLREDLVPRGMDASQEFSPRTRMAFASMHMMGDLDLSGQDIPVGRIVDAWSGISKWISFVFSVRVASSAPQTPDRNRAFAAHRLVLLWYRLLTCEHLSGLLMQMPMGPEMASRLWREAANAPQPLVRGSSSATAMFVSYLLRLPLYPERQEAIIRSMGSDVDAFADVALNHLALAIPKGDERMIHSSWTNMDGLFILLGQFIFAKPLLQAFLSRGAVTIITTTFSEVASICDEVPDPALTMNKAALSALTFLLASFSDESGRTWCMEAIRGGFFDGLCACCNQRGTWNSPGAIRTVRSTVEVIASFLVYGSTIEEVSRSILIDRDRKRLCVLSGPLKEAWDSLVAFVTDRAVLLASFEEERTASRTGMMCDNERVRNRISLNNGTSL